jgi:hypothetical protein
MKRFPGDKVGHPSMKDDRVYLDYEVQPVELKDMERTNIF